LRIVHSFPHEVRGFENVWIPMPDGCRLAARIWMPVGAETSPVPAILEYIPYRKRDHTRERDEPMHRYFAGHGYAAVRVDLRGTGESEGLLLDEYLEREREDALEVIRWIAAQPWCDGAVGMMGKSWGGLNSLQVAALRPPALRAILTVCSTDDRYADDAHYMGGCLLLENLIWGSVLFTLNAQPPDPALTGERWRAMWRQRLEANPLFVETWLRHPRRDGYWKSGSVCEDYSRIRCPVYAVGGWADGYSNAVPRLLAGLTVPRKGLVGPWAHVYPHQGVPKPAIGFLQEAIRWWDQWLKGVDTGLLAEPAYRVWMQEGVVPETAPDRRPGRWVAEDGWPTDRIRARRYVLHPRGRLAESQSPVERVEWRSPQTVGLGAGVWCVFGAEGEMPTDQREDDGKSLVFDSDPLAERVEILGAPVARLALAVDRPRAFVAVRVNDVAPDGATSRVTYGLLDLAHREGHEDLRPVEPGEPMSVEIRLNDVAHVFEKGHRVRVAISTAYWPVAWPSPEAVTLTLSAGESSLDLPVRPPRAEDADLPPFGRPEAAPPAAVTDLHESVIRRTTESDPATGETAYRVVSDATETGDVALSFLDEIGLEFGHAVFEEYRIREDDPLSARAEVVHKTLSRRGEWTVRVETRTVLTSTKEAYRIEARLEAWEGEARVFEKTWDRRVPRE